MGFEPTRPRGQRILSPPCLPFHHSGECGRVLHDATRYALGVAEFLVGIVVGASLAGLVMILVGSRRVRAEGPLERDVETKLLLGRDPDEPTIPPPVSSPGSESSRHYSSAELAQLRKLGLQRGARSRRRG